MTSVSSQSLDLLLSQVCDITLKHREECVLEACVRVLCALCSDCYSFCGRAERAVSQLLDSTVEKFTSNLAEILQVYTHTHTHSSRPATLPPPVASDRSRSLFSSSEFKSFLYNRTFPKEGFSDLSRLSCVCSAGIG